MRRSLMTLAPFAGAILLAGVVAAYVQGQKPVSGGTAVQQVRTVPLPDSERRVLGAPLLEVRPDGTQVYLVPVRVKQPDGTWIEQMGQLEATPAPVAEMVPELLLDR